MLTDSPNRIMPLEGQYCTIIKTTAVGDFPVMGAADSTPPPGTVSPGASLARYFMANGLFYVIQLTGQGQSLALLEQRLGPLYAQVLASFKPGPGKPGNDVCAS